VIQNAKSKSDSTPTKHTWKIPCPLNISQFSPASISPDLFSPAPFVIKTPKMSVVRFSSDTKKHDGLCKSSSALEDIAAGYINGDLTPVKDWKSFCTKMDCHNHIPFVRESIKVLILRLKNVTDDEHEIPLLLCGGGKGLMLNCVHLEKLEQLYNLLQDVVPIT
jgi:hypothetical protein